MATLGATLSTSTWNAAQTVQYATPTVGATVTASAGANVILLINPAGTIATLTVALNGSPVDGDQLTIGASQIVGALTVSGGTLIGTLTSLAVAGFARYIYNATAAVWFRIG